ncbi:glycosyltransferase [Persicobacter diffluens]|uniref:Glycosyl transferase family 2 n=1 Tax=Persicobacter diffluens TaxID=981 RepID=A0AAN4VUT0_9BACT|nr:glycosyl transferase family 2 [Persicobacter diffluens]
MEDIIEKYSGNPSLFFLLISWLIAGGLQMIYHGLLFSRIWWQKPKNSPRSSLPKLSLIVAIHNEEKNIPELLEHLQKQKYPEDWELLFVDDRSTDRSRKLLLEQKKINSHLNIISINETPAGKSPKKYAIQQGILHAQHNHMVFTDADCRPASEDWLFLMASKFQKNIQFVLGYSPYNFHKGFLNLFIRFETLLSGISYLSLAMWGNPYMGVGRNLAYQKGFFLDHGGFSNHDQILSGDDDLLVNEMANKHNTDWEIHPAAFVYSKPKESWRAFIHQKTRHLSAGVKYRFTDRLLLGCWVISKVFFWLLLPLNLWHFGLSINLLAFGLLVVAVISINIKLSAERLREKVSIWSIPILDLLYVFYYVLTGLRTLFIKQTQWNHHQERHFQQKH